MLPSCNTHASHEDQLAFLSKLEQMFALLVSNYKIRVTLHEASITPKHAIGWDLYIYASHTKNGRHFHSIVSQRSHFKIHNNNKHFSSISQSQSIGWAKEKPVNNCQTTRIVTKSFVQFFSTHPVYKQRSSLGQRVQKHSVLGTLFWFLLYNYRLMAMFVTF